MAKAQPVIISKNGNGLFHDTAGNSYARVDEAPGTIQDRLAPHNVEAERATLGALLIDPDAILKVATFLEPGDFFIHKHGWIYQAQLNLARQDQPADDILLIADQLRLDNNLEEEALAGIQLYLSELIAKTPSSVHVDFYGRIVRRCAILRRLVDAGGEIARLAYQDTEDIDEVVDRAEEIIFGVSASSRKESGLTHIREGLEGYYDRLEYLRANKSMLVGIPTGLTDLDKCLGGLQRSDMVVVAGRPSMGKTSLALAIALQAARKWQKRVAVFSLEMSDEQIIQRLIAAETGIDGQRLRFGDIQEDEWSTFIQATSSLADTSIFIDDTPAISAFELRSKARRLAAEHGLDLLIVDYLQLMRGDAKSENRQQEISFISRSIKALARELNIPVLALSQLSRAVESRQDKRPMLSDLRESGSIEQDADVVMFLYRDDVYNPETEFPGMAEIIVGKHRSGPTGTFSVYFKRHLNQFVGVEVKRIPLEPMPEKPELVGGGVKRYLGKNGRNGKNGNGQGFTITKKL